MNRFCLKNHVISVMSTTPNITLKELGALTYKRSGKNKYQFSTLRDYYRKFRKGKL